MEIIGIKTRIFKENESLFDFVNRYTPRLREGDILVVTSKIIALSEGRTGKLRDKELLIRKESKKVIQTPWAFLTKGDDGWGINAGVDESNAQEKIILLPKDVFKTANLLRRNLSKKHRLKKFGVIITDTRSVPLRKGTVGRALGFAGFQPIKSYIGKKDMFGRKSRVTESNQADALAAAAVIEMGEGNEMKPIAVIKRAPVTFLSNLLSTKSRDLTFPPEKDIFSRVFSLSRASHDTARKRRSK